ncbi:TMC domain-containing protein [Ditylenchus destructor]|uniref:TMC domain-containing protein n=1 Tax=Ditylenchus destructor TaxID=166010 RepID=A0AAD4N6F9_9BILA|nr:TMC domain-containing protein [Ditylenchus destructor]
MANMRKPPFHLIMKKNSMVCYLYFLALETTKFSGTTEIARISSDEVEHFNDHICWETVIGQEIVKLVTMDLYITIASIFVIDFLRGYWIRYCSSWWCWDIETTFPEYGEFKVAENVLHIINNQGMIWLGLFFAPLLPAINNVKMIIIMYIRAWACMTCNVPAREIFRASRSSNFFLMILLLWLLLCTLPVGYVITSKRPSSICGPFAGKAQFYEVITDLIEQHVSKKVLRWLKYIASPGVIIPIILLLMLIIFFLVSLVRGLREANTDLQKQLIHERTEEKKKIFELAGGGSKKKTSALGISAKIPTKKVPLQHLPEIERKRREPWRLYNGTDRAPSLCPTDEPPSSVHSPLSDESPPLKPARSRISPKSAITTDLLPVVRSHFRPSLGSLNEADNSASDNPSATGNERSHKSSSSNKDRASMSMSKSVSLARSARSGQTDRADDWFNMENETTRSDDNDSFNNEVQSNTEVEINTPDDLASLIVPYYGIDRRSIFLPSDSAVSLAAFPKETSSSPVTVIFGSGSISRRSSSKRNSYISLYDNMDDSAMSSMLPITTSVNFTNPSARSMRLGSFSKVLRQPQLTSQVTSDKPTRSTAIIPKTMPTIMTTCTTTQARSVSPSSSHMSRSDTFPGPATEAPQRISIYSREPRRLGQTPLQQTAIVAKVNTAPTPPRKPTPQPSATAKPPAGPGTSKYESKELSDSFVPWPSIEEVKKQRANLFPQKPPRSRSPPKMVRSEHKTRSPSADTQPTRFRISISPTRKLQPDDEDSEGGTAPGTSSRRKPRYIIKQQPVIAGSVSSFGSRVSMTVEQSPGRSITSTPLAPRVEFGDDDSPRVEQAPSKMTK